MKKLLKSSAFMISMALVIVGICISAYALLIAPKQQANNSKNNTVANNPSGTSNGGIYFVAPGGKEIQAIYLAPQNGGLITDTELENYPKILKVSDFNTLNSFASKYIIPVWIDKDAIDLLPQGWVNEYPQKFYPIIVVGYNNALYSMREKLDLPIFGPPWLNLDRIEPGFSAWMIESESATDLSAFMKGYAEPVAAERILEVSNELLKKSLSIIEYKNTQYGFTFSLPVSWEGYSIVEDKWEGEASVQGSDVVVEQGPIILIRHPKWTSTNPRQDIPIMVFTISEWNELQQEKFYLGAAPIGPAELGRNSKYVFALPARYNFAFLPGFEEVEEILENNSLKAF